MVEKIVKDYLQSSLEIPVRLEEEDDLGNEYVLIEKTGSKKAIDFSINIDLGHQHNASPVRWRAVAIVTAITIQTIIPAPICEFFGCIKHFKCMTIVIFRI